MSKPEEGGSGQDPLIDEVRRVREELSRKHGNDPARLAEELRRIERAEQERGRRIVPAPERADDQGSKAG